MKASLLSGLCCLCLLCGSCTAPAQGSTQGIAQARQGSSASGTTFPAADPPRYAVDERPQREQDLETIGRPR